ncbi:MAG: DUF5709 domain-containing protein [Pseudonocardiales bacterium]
MAENGMFGDSVYSSGDPVDDTDDRDPVETLTGDDPDEAMQTGYDPPDREPYNLRHVPTAAEESRGASLEDQLAQEEPDISADDPSTADRQPRAGRLVAPDEGGGADAEAAAIASDAGPAGYAASAEEAAMHVVDES